ncbi:hypothetical protein [Nonomuraea sp. NPDC049158]|uniref:hypothetical protein n=1 Tax=Nonomuraea sp. NPDC049158 TaxID=3155649 RepID=UPI0033CD9C09
MRSLVPVPVRACGELEILPYVPIALRLRTGVSIRTYGDQVAFGVTGDYDGAPEVEPLARTIENELQALSLAYRPSPALSVVTPLRASRHQRHHRRHRPLSDQGRAGRSPEGGCPPWSRCFRLTGRGCGGR